MWDQLKSRSLAAVAGCATVMSSAACGGSYPAPTQPLADAEAADRSAAELGADADPAAKLHLRLAREQTANAKKLMSNGENRRAQELLLRAKADAELALSLAREQKAKAEANQMIEKSDLQTKANGAGVEK